MKAAKPPPTNPSKAAPRVNEEEWEVKPCGMLVQKRLAAGAAAPPPPIRVRVKYGAATHDAYVSRLSTFGELKKLLSHQTGVHHLDQKLIFKGKERDSSSFLDRAGVKEKSKIVLVEDTAAKARRIMDIRRTAITEKISQITAAVDQLAAEVDQLRSREIAAEKEVNGLTELLMDQLLKLDAIIAEGQLKILRRKEVTRVQKLVESLDELKAKKSTPLVHVEKSTPVISASKSTPMTSVEKSSPGLSTSKSTPTISAGESNPFIPVSKSTPMFSVEKSTPTVAVVKSTPLGKEVDWGMVDLLSGSPPPAAVKFDWELF